MLYKIKKGTHRARPLTLGFFSGKRSIKKAVTFKKDCSYILPGGDWLDMNKLYGLGYFWNLHTDSARFSWRWDPFNGRITLGAYCYVNGERINIPLKSVGLEEMVILEIRIEGGRYHFFINDALQTAVVFTHKKYYGFPLGLYFGGNNKAPHTMEVEVKNL